MRQILWVDDEIDLLQPYIIYLKDKGYEVITASNGEDALDIVNGMFDIVFLDENMPGMTGLETLQEIKRRHPELPVVMITKSEEEHIMEQAIGEKIADYLIKPVNPSQILLCLKKHIHQQEIVSEQARQNYREEWGDISYMINTASTFEEWQAVARELSKWDIDLENSSMRSMVDDQRAEANSAFSKWIAKNYVSLVGNQKQKTEGAGEVIMSHNVMKQAVFPLLDKGEKVLFCVIDNFRYDQWKTIQPLLSEWYSIRTEQQYMSILPTATQYARMPSSPDSCPCRYRRCIRTCGWRKATRRARTSMRKNWSRPSLTATAAARVSTTGKSTRAISANGSSISSRVPPRRR